jgi:hypothetical protein
MMICDLAALFVIPRFFWRYATAATRVKEIRGRVWNSLCCVAAAAADEKEISYLK